MQVYLVRYCRVLYALPFIIFKQFTDLRTMLWKERNVRNFINLQLHPKSSSKKIIII